MRIIHTADLHLYSSFGSFKDKEKARIRKNETVRKRFIVGVYVQ